MLLFLSYSMSILSSNSVSYTSKPLGMWPLCRSPSYHAGPNDQNRFTRLLKKPPPPSLCCHACSSSDSFQYSNQSDFFLKCSLLKNVPMASYLSQVKAKVLTMAWRSYIIYLIFYPLMDLTYYLLPCSLHSSHNDFHALPGTQDTSVSGPFT